MREITAIGVDDEQHNLRLLERALTGSAAKLVATYTSPQQALQEIRGLCPDIAFVDIEMPEMSGLAFAEEVADLDTLVVFVTAYSAYAIDAIKVGAFDYLLKPVQMGEMTQLLKRFRSYPDRQLGKIERVRSVLAATRITALGGFEVAVGGRPVSWATAKVEELFAYLLIRQGQTVDKGELCELLWYDIHPEKARANLYTSIYRLKKTLREAGITIEIKSRGSGYCLLLNDTRFDYLEFLAAEGRDLCALPLDQLEELEALYQGELLFQKGYHWSMGLDEEARRLYRKIALHLAARLEQEGKAERRMLCLKKAFGVFPDDEKIAAQLIEAHLQQGERHFAAKADEIFREHLDTQLGVAPSAAYEQAVHRLLFAGGPARVDI